MKKLLVMLIILCIYIPVYSAFKEHTIFEKNIDLLKSIRSSAVSIEATLKNNNNTVSSLLTSYAKDIDATKNIIVSKDKTNIEQIQSKIDNILIALNDLISTIDTLYPEIK